MKLRTLCTSGAAGLVAAAFLFSASAFAEVPMISGGVGDEELSDITSLKQQYNVRLLFTEQNGVYLSDVPVTITDTHGQTVVDTKTTGPLLYMKLPAGSYKLSAMSEGVVRDLSITASEKSQREYQLRFPTEDAELSK